MAIGCHDSREQADAVAEELRESGAEAEAFGADVSKRGEVQDMVRRSVRRFGRIDALVNNAGIMPATPLLETTEDMWDVVVRTDLYGAFFCSQAVIPLMLEQGGGKIVNIASRLGQIGCPGYSAYASAKAALIAFTKSVAREFGPRGIQINAVAPGVVNTDMGRAVIGSAEGARRAAEVPLGRFAEPDEIALTVLFLLSTDSTLYLGQTLAPNGGSHMP